MASANKVAVLAALVLLLQVSSCAVARHHHHHPEPHPGGGGTPAVMTVNGFGRGEDGGGPSECDGKFHSDHELVAALSTRWYASGKAVPQEDPHHEREERAQRGGHGRGRVRLSPWLQGQHR
ncbi:hypothetical protein EJB05_21877, partial [Eragrostis curvula]